MRVLGIDPGYAIVGLGVVEYAGNRFAPIAYGAVCTDKDTPFEQRLIEIYGGIKDICTRYQPEALSIEKLYYQHNQTTLILGRCPSGGCGSSDSALRPWPGRPLYRPAWGWFAGAA